MKRTVHSITLALAALLGIGAGPSAAAPAWTELPTGTTSEITAIEYQGPDRMWFTTASGEIFRRVGASFVREHGPTGLPLTDIEFRPGGNLGFAVGNAGQVFRSVDHGDTWFSVNTGASPIVVSRPDCKGNEPLGNVNAVRFAGANRVWILAQGSQIARSESATLGGLNQWVNVNRDTKATADAGDDTCRVPTGSGTGDAFFVPYQPNVGYFCTGYFGEIFLTTNHLADAAAKQSGSCGQDTIANDVMAGDPFNPNRMWSVGPGGPSPSHLRITQDAWASTLSPELGNGERRAFARPYDVAFNGGTVLIAGDAGMILNSIDGRTFFYVDAPGALGMQDWRAVALAGPSSAAVGGAGGKLVISDNVNTLPDDVRPTGSIGGPSEGQTGQPLTFTAQLADNAGGSGIDEGSLQWTVLGFPQQSGPTATYTFSSSGSHTIQLAFRDREGNDSTATKTVSISPPPVTPAPTPAPVTPARLTLPARTPARAVRRGNFVIVTVKGNVGRPPGVSVAEACTGSVLLRIRRGRRSLASKSVRQSSCTFRKTFRIKRKRVGRARMLRLGVIVAGNSRVRGVSRTYTVKVKRR